MRRIFVCLIVCACTLFIVLGVGADITQFVGKWSNSTPKNRGLTRVEISFDGTQVKVHPYGSCHPTDCDMGEMDATAYGPSVDSNALSTAQAIVVEKTTSFSEMMMVIRLLDRNRLQVESFTKFTDRSGRASYTAVETFTRSR